MGIVALPNIQKLSPYVPGLSIAEIQEKYNLSQIIKMASNENPLGVSPVVKEAISRASCEAFRYPQGGNPRLAQAIAKFHNVNPENVVVGNGSDEIIDLIIRIFAKSEKNNIVCFDPCFSIYPIQSAINCNKVKKCPVNNDFSFDFEKLLALVDEDTRIVFITTPDNPSGYCPPAESVKKLADDLKKKNPAAILVIDEAYMDFSGEPDKDEKLFSLLDRGVFPENVIFLRTFSKSFGLAGLRLGYGIFPPGLANFYWRARLPFSVNIIAEAAGIAALQDSAFREETLKTVREGRQMLASALTDLGFKVWPSHANFLLIQPPQDIINAHKLHEELLKKGIIIRALDSYKLPEHLRVSIGNKQENRQFLEAVKNIMENYQKKD